MRLTPRSSARSVFFSAGVELGIGWSVSSSNIVKSGFCLKIKETRVLFPVAAEE